MKIFNKFYNNCKIIYMSVYIKTKINNNNNLITELLIK